MAITQAGNVDLFRVNLTTGQTIRYAIIDASLQHPIGQLAVIVG